MSAEQTPDIETAIFEVIVQHQRIPMYGHIPGLQRCSAGCPDLLAESDGPNSPRHARHVAQALAPVLAAAVREAVNEAITGLYHPEFGTEWREDGSLYKIVREAEQRALREAAYELPGGMSSNGARDWLRDRADRITEPVSHEAATSGEESED